MNVIISGDLDSCLAHLVARSEGNCSCQPIFRLQESRYSNFTHSARGEATPSGS